MRMPCRAQSQACRCVIFGCRADGENQLTESLVVVEYLDAKYGGDSPILPREPAQLAKVSNPSAFSVHA